MSGSAKKCPRPEWNDVPALLTEGSRSNTNASMKFFASSLSVLFVVALAGCASPNERAERDGWTWLFDGTSTDAFRAYKRDTFPKRGWSVENGTLKTIPGGDVVDLVTKERFKNFDLHLDWKISPGGNSGVMYHVTENFPKSYNTGPEMQILDDSKHKDGANPKTSAGALYALIAPTNKVLNPVGEWNHARIRVLDNHVEHWLNGKKVVEYDLNSPELEKLIADSKFKDMPRFAKEETGRICLQNHRAEVWFRNIRIHRL